MPLENKCLTSKMYSAMIKNNVSTEEEIYIEITISK